MTTYGATPVVGPFCSQAATRPSVDLHRIAEEFAEAAKHSLRPLFASGLAGFSRFYETLAVQEKAIEGRDLKKQDEQQQDGWLNEGGSEPHVRPHKPVEEHNGGERTDADHGERQSARRPSRLRLATADAQHPTEGTIMTGRTTETTVTFRHAFKLSSFDRPQPPGTYRLVIDEEEILGLSFLAYHRTSTMLHTPAVSLPHGPHQVFVVDSAELEATIEADTR